MDENSSEDQRTTGAQYPDDRRRVWVTFAFVIAGTLAAGLAQIGLTLAFGYTLEQLQAGVPKYTPDQTLIVLGTTQALSYLIPGIIAAYALFGPLWARQTQLSPRPQLLKLLLGIGIFIATLAMTAALGQLNQSIQISDWMADAESGVNEILRSIIMDTTWPVFVLVLSIVALLPAVGEELVFRGLIQPGIIARTGSLHVGVWLTALMFALVHVQFAGILPRIFLGGVLGFLAVYSQRLWIPIAAHALFNGSQVLAARLEYIDIVPKEPQIPDANLVYLTIAGGIIASAALHFGLPHLRPGGFPIGDETDAVDLK